MRNTWLIQDSRYEHIVGLAGHHGFCTELHIECIYSIKLAAIHGLWLASFSLDRQRSTHTGAHASCLTASHQHFKHCCPATCLNSDSCSRLTYQCVVAQPSHALFKEILAGAAGFEVDRLVETKGLDAIDRYTATPPLFLTLKKNSRHFLLHSAPHIVRHRLNDRPDVLEVRPCHVRVYCSCHVWLHAQARCVTHGSEGAMLTAAGLTQYGHLVSARRGLLAQQLTNQNLQICTCGKCNG